MPQPRPYQDALANHTTPSLWRTGKRRVVWCAPVGSGKTLMAELLISRVRAADWAAVFYVAHQAELLSQPGERFRHLGIEHGYVKAGWLGDSTAGVQVCGAQTLVRREVVPPPREDGTPHVRCVVFIDECHRVRASTYHIILQRLSAAFRHVYAVLMTATPYRRDGRGLADVADALVEVVTPRELFAAGVILDPVVYSRPPTAMLPDLMLGRERGGDIGTDSDAAANGWDLSATSEFSVVTTPGIVGDVVATWLRHADGVPTVARCVNRAHARDVARRLCDAGVRAATIDGTMTEDARGLLLARLAVGGAASTHPLALDVLCSGGTIMEEGFDSAASYRHVLSRRGLWAGGEPPPYVPLGCLIDAAPTTSRGAWIQRVGRVCRAFGPDDVAAWDARGLRAQVKPRAVVLCHSGNLERHGFLVQHEGFQLTVDRLGAPRVRDSAYPAFRPPQVVQCPHCFASVPRGSPTCPTCDAESEAVGAPALPDERPGELTRRKFDPSALPPPTDAQREDYLRKMWAKWCQVRDQRAAAGLPPYSQNWPAVRYRVRFAGWPDWNQNRAVARLFGIRL